MMRLALATIRRRLAAFVGTFLTAFLAVGLITGSGSLLFSVLTAEAPVDRFAVADVVVSGERAIVLTTEKQKEDKVKTKTKSERLAGAAELPSDLVERIAATPGVARAVPDAAFAVELVDAGGRPIRAPERAAVVAHGWVSAELTPYTLRTGGRPGREQVVLDAALAKAGGVRVGDTVGMTTRTGVRQLSVVGVAAPGGADTLPGQAAVFVADEQVAQLSGLSGPTAVGVVATPGVNAGDLAATLSGRVDGAFVHTGQDKATGDLPGAVPDYISAISIFGFVLGITGFAAVFVLTGTVALTVRQRLRELALLRTAGATPGQLRRLISAENAIVALAASVPGLPAGIVVAHLIAARFRELGAVPAQFTVVVNPLVLIAAVLIGLLVTQLAAGVAARRAIRIAPSQALTETVTAPGGSKVPRVIAAIVLATGAVLVLALVPLGGQYGMGMGFVSSSLLLCSAAALGPMLVGGINAVISRPVGLTGATGRLAAAVSRAQVGRVTAVAVPLTLMFAINATMLLNSELLSRVTGEQQVARSAPATLVASAGNGGGLPLSMTDSVSALPAVTGAAATIRTKVIIDEGGKPEDHPAQGLRVLGRDQAIDLGVQQGSMADFGKGTVAVSGMLAGNRGWSLGDTPEFWLADGTRTTLRIVAVYDRWRGFGDIVLPAELAAGHDPRGLVGALYLRGEAGLADQVRSGWPMLGVADVADQTVRGGDAQSQQAAWELMVIISLGFTAIAVANTFAIATSARRGEFRDLRLAGATSRQLHRMITRETAITTAVGLVIGCVIAAIVVGAFSIAQDGQWRLVVDPLRYLGMVAGVGLLGMVCGVIPARLVIRRRALPDLGD